MYTLSNEVSSDRTVLKSPSIEKNCQDKNNLKKTSTPNDTNPDTLIGGTKVVHTNDGQSSLKKNISIFEDDNEESPLSTLDSEENASNSSYSSKNQKKLESQSEPSRDTSHKIFTFSLPFGGKSLLSSHPITNLVSSILPNDPDPKSNEYPNLNRERIKEKLKRSDSITSLEEMALFNDEKGIDNVRTRAFKKTFEMETLKQTLKNIIASPGECTHDGYEYTRLESIWDEMEGDLLLMGGYRGSILRDAQTGRRLWIPMKAGLNLRKVNLLIGPDDRDEVETQKKIIPDKMLSHIGPVDISRRLMKKLRSNPNITTHDFGYDWRLSLHISAKHLAQKLQSIYDNQEEKKGTTIIAHSMGGLVAHKVLQEHTHLIRALIYVGSPSECSNILGPLKFGDEVFMNKTILSKEANFFMRSSFYFLPTDGTCFVNKKTLEKCEIDFFNPDVWVELGLSPVVDEERKVQAETQEDNQRACHSKKEEELARTESKKKQPEPGIPTDVKDLWGIFNPIPMLKSISSPGNDSSSGTGGTSSTLKSLTPASIITKITTTATDAIGLTESKDCQEEEEEMAFQTSFEDSFKYLRKTLKRAKEYQTSLDRIAHKEYPPLAIVFGNTVPTVRGVKISSWKDIKEGHYDDFYYGPGDGVVHHKWLLPEQRGFQVDAKIASSCGHVSLLSDLESMAKAFISVVDKEKANQQKHQRQAPTTDTTTCK